MKAAPWISSASRSSASRCSPPSRGRWNSTPRSAPPVASTGKYGRDSRSSRRAEREVLNWSPPGRLNKQIADALGIAERTVKARARQVMAKPAGNAAELGRIAAQLRGSAG